MLPVNSSFGWAVSEETIFSIAKWLTMAAMYVNGSGQNEETSWMTSIRCFISNMNSFGPAFSVENNFLISIYQKQESPKLAIYVDRMEGNEEILYRTSYKCLPSNTLSFGQAVSE